jgi:hypothetical protein
MRKDFNENASQASMPRRYEHIDRVDLWVMAQKQQFEKCVSPELDAAISGLVEALRYYECGCNRGNCRRCKAIEAYDAAVEKAQDLT